LVYFCSCDWYAVISVCIVHIPYFDITSGMWFTNIGVRARAWGLQSPQTRTVIIFRAEASSQNEKIFFGIYLNEKTELILSSEIKCPKSGFY